MMTFGPELLLAVLASLTAGSLVLAATAVFTPQKPMHRRARQLLDPNARKRQGRTAEQRQGNGPAGLPQLLKRLTNRFEGLRVHAGAEAAERLSRAGWRSKDALVLFVCARIALPFVCGAVALLLFDVLHVVALGPPLDRVAPACGVILGFLLPGQVVGRAITKREKAILRSLPNALDLLVICAEAGLSLDFALQRVAGEMEKSDPEAADEIGLTALERRLLPDRRRALENLGKRCQLPSVRALVQTLLQAEEYGTPLSQALRVLASEMRTERMLRAESKAAKAPVLMTVPLVACIMPALFIVLIGPGLLQTIDALSSM